MTRSYFSPVFAGENSAVPPSLRYLLPFVERAQSAAAASAGAGAEADYDPIKIPPFPLFAVGDPFSSPCCLEPPPPSSSSHAYGTFTGTTISPLILFFIVCSIALQ